MPLSLTHLPIAYPRCSATDWLLSTGGASFSPFLIHSSSSAAMTTVMNRPADRDRIRNLASRSLRRPRLRDTFGHICSIPMHTYIFVLGLSFFYKLSVGAMRRSMSSVRSLVLLRSFIMKCAFRGKKFTVPKPRYDATTGSVRCLMVCLSQ